MPGSTVRYADTTLRKAAVVTAIGSLACVAWVVVAAVDGSALGTVSWLIAALFLAFISFFYRSAIPVEVVVGSVVEVVVEVVVVPVATGVKVVVLMSLSW